MKHSYYFTFMFVLIAAPAFAQVDYASQIQPIFNANCTSCHGVSSGLTLSSYGALIGSTGNQYGSDIIVAGDPDASGLVDKIEASPQFGSRMPQGRNPLSDEEIQLIRTWISEGANEVATDIENEEIIPAEFKVYGNFPNPFNPGTLIRFSTPVAVNYTIAVYSVHGQLVAEYAGFSPGGNAAATVDLRSQPTGIYLYRVIARFDNQVKVLGSGRMTLIK